MAPLQGRLYDTLLKGHLASERQIALVAGPRQVGKTTTCRSLADNYLNWDNPDHRRIIVEGPRAVADYVGLDRLGERPVVLFDELHKYARWKSFLKGFFDTHEDRLRIIVTGNARLDVFRRGGDSLMGRHFLYRMHPWSVAERLQTTSPGDAIVRAPRPLPDEDWNALQEHGGFPEPFLRREKPFSRRWRGPRYDLLMREDTRDATRIEDLAALEMLGALLRERSSQHLVYSTLAREAGVTVDIIRRWLDLFERLYYGFRLRPWFRNVNRSLRKEPKWYLRDWSGIADRGARAETLVACHLLKAVEGWTDMGLGTFELRYLRDKDKREVDFVVIRDRHPWFLVEVKAADETLSESLGRMQAQTRARHAFQCAVESPFVDADCFRETRPIIVPARTLLSQLL